MSRYQKIKAIAVALRATTNDCILWQWAKQPGGYGIITKNKRNFNVTRVVMARIHGDLPQGHVVAHKCDNPACFNPKHLFIGTPADNVRDMINKGRNPKGSIHWAARMPERVLRGEKVGTSKLTQSDVEQIRNDYRPGSAGHPSEFSLSGLSRKYGVSFQTIHKIVKNQRWTEEHQK